MKAGPLRRALVCLGCYGPPEPPAPTNDELISRLGRHPRASSSGDSARSTLGPLRSGDERRSLDAASRLAGCLSEPHMLSAVDHLTAAGTYYKAAAAHMRQRDEGSAADCLRLAESHVQYAQRNGPT